MESVATDLFATKGAEYLLVIAYLVLLVAGWRMVFPRKSREQIVQGPSAEPRRFLVPEGFYFHQGHGWAQPDDGNVVSVGLDDFAQKLLGLTYGVQLPAMGSHLTEGEPGWQVQLADGSTIPMLAPVDGEVVGVNPEVLLHPGLMNSDPYGRGWLMKVRVHNPTVLRRNLLSYDLARAWMDKVGAGVPHVQAPELGIVLPGGSFGATGLARALSPDGWQHVAREYLLIEEPRVHVEKAVSAGQGALTV